MVRFATLIAAAGFVSSISAAPATPLTAAQIAAAQASPSSSSFFANLLGRLNLISDIETYINLSTAPTDYLATSNFKISNFLPNLGVIGEDIYFVSVDVQANYKDDTYATIQHTFDPPLRVPAGKTVTSPNVTTTFVSGKSGEDPFVHALNLLTAQGSAPFHLDLVTADKVTFQTTLLFGIIKLPLSVPLQYNQKNITFNPIIYVV